MDTGEASPLVGWAADPRMARVCHNPLCRLHEDGIQASRFFRMALQMYSRDADSALALAADGDIQDDTAVQPYTGNPTGEEQQAVAYVVNFVNLNMGMIGADPTQRRRRECSHTTLSLLAAQGNSFVYFICSWQQTIFKAKAMIAEGVEPGAHVNTHDFYSDMVVAIRPDEEMRRWLISIDYIKPDGSDPDARALTPKEDKDKEMETKEVVMYLARSTIVAYHARNMSVDSAESFKIWPQYKPIIEDPGSRESLKFAAGIGHTDCRFQEMKKINKGTGPNTKKTDVQQQDGHPHVTLGTLQQNVAPLLPEGGDRARCVAATREEVVRRQKIFSSLFKNTAASGDVVSRLTVPECKHDMTFTVALASLVVMNPLALTDQRNNTKAPGGREVTRMEELLQARCVTRMREQEEEGIFDSAVISIPFPGDHQG